MNSRFRKPRRSFLGAHKRNDPPRVWPWTSTAFPVAESLKEKTYTRIYKKEEVAYV